MRHRVACYIPCIALIVMALSLLAGCSAPDKGNSALDFYFDRDGGTVNGPFGVRIVIPMDAVTNTCNAGMTFSKSAPAPKPAGTELTITAWLSLEEGCNPLLKPATLIMPLSTSAINPKGMFSPEPVGEWTSIPALTNDDGLVMMEIDRSGYYTFISEE